MSQKNRAKAYAKRAVPKGQVSMTQACRWIEWAASVGSLQPDLSGRELLHSLNIKKGCAGCYDWSRQWLALGMDLTTHSPGAPHPHYREWVKFWWPDAISYRPKVAV